MGMSKLIDPGGGPQEEDPELHPDPSCEFPPFADDEWLDDDDDDE